MINSALISAKPYWLNQFLPLLLARLNTEMYQTKEEIFKLVHSILDHITSPLFEIIVFQSKHSLFTAVRNSLSSYETNPETIITILSLLIKIISFYKTTHSSDEDVKIQQIVFLLDSNAIISIVEKLQSHKLQGIYNHTVSLLEIYNHLQ